MFDNNSIYCVILGLWHGSTKVAELSQVILFIIFDVHIMKHFQDSELFGKLTSKHISIHYLFRNQTSVILGRDNMCTVPGLRFNSHPRMRLYSSQWHVQSGKVQ